MLARAAETAGNRSGRNDALLILKGFLPVWAVLAVASLVSFATFTAFEIGISAESWQIFIAVHLCALLLLAASWAWGRPALVRAVASCAVFVQMTAPLALFSYAAVAIGHANPLYDADLARMDAMIGVDWLALVSWFNQYPLLVLSLERAYHGTIVPVIFTLVLLNLLGRTQALVRFNLLFIGACLLCTALSAAFPAVGAYVHYQPAQDMRSAISADAGIWHLQHFQALRDGTFRMFDLSTTEGLVTFPSFHTAAALAIPLALRGLGAITALAWIVAGVIVVSTVPIGGHHVIDVIAGAALVLGLDGALRRARGWRLKLRRPPELRLLPA